jgi:aconitate hydratase
MGTIVPAISGPKRPQDYVPLTNAKAAFAQGDGRDLQAPDEQGGGRRGRGLHDGIGQGRDRLDHVLHQHLEPLRDDRRGAGGAQGRGTGPDRKPWVKTSLAPGSQVVSAYLEAAGLQEDLDKIGFNLVGYGCTTCIGNSGPLQKEISEAIAEGDLVATSVLSGNRNFEGRISPDVRANYLASPPLVVAYALAGTMDINLATDPIAQTPDGKDVYLKDIWPTQAEIAELVEATVTREAFIEKYADVFKGDEKWQGVEVTEAEVYDWPASSTYIQNPPYFRGMGAEPGTISNIEGAKVLAILGDMVTTDHISPAGSFKDTTPAGRYLVERQVPVREFNSYGSRRGNHEVMMRGTFANIRIKNEMLDGVEGGYTLGPDGQQTSIFDAAMAYQEEGTPLVVFGGEQYGAGSSRDWAAKGTNLLGVKAVIAESFERIHRSNLVGMGVIPFEFTGGDNRKTLGPEGRRDGGDPRARHDPAAAGGALHDHLR